MLLRGQGAIEQPFDKRLAKKSIAQGAIEYLLLLAAAIVVVAIVIGFMTGILNTGMPVGDKAKLESMCKDLIPPEKKGDIDYLTQECKCYLGISDTRNSPLNDSNADICCKKEDSYLRTAWNCK